MSGYVFSSEERQQAAEIVHSFQMRTGFEGVDNEIFPRSDGLFLIIYY